MDIMVPLTAKGCADLCVLTWCAPAKSRFAIVQSAVTWKKLLYLLKGKSLWYGNLQKDRKNKMQHTNPNAHTYVNGTGVETHGYAVMQNTFLQ